jgi:hypothetical protein
MKTYRLVTTLASILAMGCAWPHAAAAQEAGDKAITARVHGTFQDSSGGLGVVSGDMTIVRFEVRNGTITAIGAIDGAIADSAGTVLGQVSQELAMPVGNVGSSCNQLRMDLAATDADVLQIPVHFDKEVAGYDSRVGTTPKALRVLCAAGEMLRGKPAADSLVRALNDFSAALAAGSVR